MLKSSLAEALADGEGFCLTPCSSDHIYSTRQVHFHGLITLQAELDPLADVLPVVRLYVSIDTLVEGLALGGGVWGQVLEADCCQLCLDVVAA